MEYRGPDDRGAEEIVTDNTQIVMGHVRLSIIDLTPTGHQPMTVGFTDGIGGGVDYRIQR